MLKRFIPVALAATLLMFTAPGAPAADPPAGTPPILATVLSIDADGKSTGTPDQATIELGVVTEATNAADAVAQNAQGMTAVLRALHNAGIADRDIRTSNISVWPQQQYITGQAPRIVSYQARNGVSITVRALANMGRTMDAAVGAGGNQVNSIRFGYADPAAHLDAARRDALTEARRRADLYAQSLGMHVFRVVSVSESSSGRGYSDEDIVVTGSRIGASAPVTPVSPGERETHVQVHVTFELR